MMRNRNNRLALATLLAFAMVAGACSCGDSNTGNLNGILKPIGNTPGVTPGDADNQLNLDFGNVSITSARGDTKTIEFVNDGSAALHLAKIAVSAPFASDVPATGLDMTPGEQKAIAFTFKPTVEGEATADAVLNYGNGKTFTVHMRGVGITPAFDCTPGTLDFGNLEVGSTRPLSIACKNTSPLSTTLKVGTVEGPTADRFSIQVPGADSQNQVTVPAGATLNIPVTFSARILERVHTTLPLYFGGSSEPGQRITLTAEVIDSALEFPQTCISFGFVPPGLTKEMPIVLRNRGSIPLTVNGLAFSASTPANVFRIKTAVPPAGLVIPADDPATTEAENELPVIVEFRPTEPGRKVGGVVVTNSSKTPNAEVCVEGYGGGPIISCSPESIDFGPVAVGIPSTRSFSCVNLGTDLPDRTDDNLVIEQITSSNAEFTTSILNADGTTTPKAGGYPAGEPFRLQVTYDPTNDGIDQATISVASNDGLTPVLDLPVIGDGRNLPPCEFEIVPSSLRFGIVGPGSNATLEFAVRNQLDTECLITNIHVQNDTDPVFSVVEVPNAFVPGSGEYRVQVTFTPPEQLPASGSAIYTGNVLFDISNPANPHQSVPLRGATQEPCALIAPDHLDFGTVAPNCSTRDRYLTIINVCDEPITVSAIELNPGASNEFFIIQRPPIPTTLTRGQQAEFTMRYRPEDLGVDVGSVFITVDSSPEPYMATLEGNGSSNAMQIDHFSQDERPKVDVLWVIDNSGSMSWVQTNLANNVNSFLSFAMAQQIDFQLGVTTTGVDAGSSTGNCYPATVGGVGGNERGRLYPVVGTTDRILTPGSPNLEEQWRINSNVGTCHGTEKGLEAAYMALSTPLVDSTDDPRTTQPNDGNLGFLRKDAHLSIIFVSDEEDQSPQTTTFYSNFFKSIKGFRNSHLYSAHAITGDPVTGCPQAFDPGDRYYAVVEESNGVFQSICAADWSAAMERMGIEAFGFKTRFFLTNEPEDTNADGFITDDINPTTNTREIEVRVNGRIVSSTNTQGARVWEYNAEVNSVDFWPLHVPKPGSQIEVTYKVACL